MFDCHAHIGPIISNKALVCTSKAEEFESVQRYPYRAYGLLAPFDKLSLDKLIQCVEKDKSALIGEFGIDRRVNDPLEMDVLNSLLELAYTLKRPFILHQVGKVDLLLKALDRYKPLPPFIVHGFTGSFECAKQIRKRGGIISLGPRSEKTKHFLSLLKEPFLLESDLTISKEEEVVIASWYKTIAKYLNISVSYLEELIDGRRAIFTP